MCVLKLVSDLNIILVRHTYSKDDSKYGLTSGGNGYMYTRGYFQCHLRAASKTADGISGTGEATAISAWFGVATRWNLRRKRELSAWTVQIPASHFSAPKSLSTMGRICQATSPKILVKLP